MNLFIQMFDFLINPIKYTLLFSYTYIIFFKLQNSNFKINYNIFIVLIFILFITTIIFNNIIVYNFLIINLLLLLILAFFVKFDIDKSLKYILQVLIFSLSYVYIIYLFSSLLIITFTRIVLNVKNFNIIHLFLSSLITFFICKRILNIKRFKNGLYFLQNENKTENIFKFGLISSFFIIYGILSYKKFSSPENIELMETILFEITFVGICMILWLWNSLSMYYKDRMLNRNLETLEKELEETKDELNKLVDENYKILKDNHRINHKINTIENVALKLLENPNIEKEFKKEYEVDYEKFLRQVNDLSLETKNIRDKNIKMKKITQTNIFELDSVLNYMQIEAIKNNIDFEIIINGSINYMIDKFVKIDCLTTLLSDHIKDAIIAINNNNSKYRRILITIGLINNNYGICIFDSGIEFEFNTLINLGLKPITTNKSIGGSGYGFMETFETLNKTKGSLEITEFKNRSNNFTKSVAIIFDNRLEYRINTYRYKELKDKDIENRIIISKNKY